MAVEEKKEEENKGKDKEEKKLTPEELFSEIKKLADEKREKYQKRTSSIKYDDTGRPLKAAIETYTDNLKENFDKLCDDLKLPLSEKRELEGKLFDEKKWDVVKQNFEKLIGNEVSKDTDKATPAEESFTLNELKKPFQDEKGKIDSAFEKFNGRLTATENELKSLEQEIEKSNKLLPSLKNYIDSKKTLADRKETAENPLDPQEPAEEKARRVFEKEWAAEFKESKHSSPDLDALLKQTETKLQEKEKALQEKKAEHKSLKEQQEKIDKFKETANKEVKTILDEKLTKDLSQTKKSLENQSDLFKMRDLELAAKAKRKKLDEESMSKDLEVKDLFRAIDSPPERDLAAESNLAFCNTDSDVDAMLLKQLEKIKNAETGIWEHPETKACFSINKDKDSKNIFYKPVVLKGVNTRTSYAGIMDFLILKSKGEVKSIHVSYEKPNEALVSTSDIKGLRELVEEANARNLGVTFAPNVIERLKTLYNNTNSILSFIKKSELDYLLKYIGTVGDQSRNQLMTKMNKDWEPKEKQLKNIKLDSDKLDDAAFKKIIDDAKKAPPSNPNTAAGTRDIADPIKNEILDTFLADAKKIEKSMNNIESHLAEIEKLSQSNSDVVKKEVLGQGVLDEQIKKLNEAKNHVIGLQKRLDSKKEEFKKLVDDDKTHSLLPEKEKKYVDNNIQNLNQQLKKLDFDNKNKQIDSKIKSIEELNKTPEQKKQAEEEKKLANRKIVS